jgi:predicted DNA-binding transcriptional regulator AlpA
MQEHENLIFFYKTGEGANQQFIRSQKINPGPYETATTTNFGLIAHNENKAYSKRSRAKAVFTKSHFTSSESLTVGPRALRREPAALYLGISSNYFDQLVAKNLIPRGRKLGNVTIWDRRELDQCVSEIFENNDANNPWDLLL